MVAGRPCDLIGLFCFKYEFDVTRNALAVRTTSYVLMRLGNGNVAALKPRVTTDRILLHRLMIACLVLTILG